MSLRYTPNRQTHLITKWLWLKFFTKKHSNLLFDVGEVFIDDKEAVHEVEKQFSRE